MSTSGSSRSLLFGGSSSTGGTVDGACRYWVRKVRWSHFDNLGVGVKCREQVSHVARVGREEGDLAVVTVRVRYGYSNGSVDHIRCTGLTA